MWKPKLKNITFVIIPPKIGIKLIKLVQDLYAKNYKMLMKETGEDLHKWGD